MFVRARWIVALCALSCRTEPPLERLPAPRAEIEIKPLPPPPPPPPPGPPPEVTFAGPPDELLPVLVQAAEPPVVRFFDLVESAAEDSFLGYGIQRRKRLEDADARRLVERLAANDSFVDGGEYGCVGDPIGVRIARGDVERDVVVDCGHMYFTTSRHAGRYELLAPEVNQLIYSLR